MFEVLGEETGNCVGLRVWGSVTRRDLQELRALLEGALERHGTLRVLVAADGLSGVKAGALFRELEPALRHLPRIERVAVVGGREWASWWEPMAARVERPQVRFFDAGETAAGWAWLGAAG
ncbi:MAG: SpoIIAA family protein [Deferrisomatales bacterium]